MAGTESIKQIVSAMTKEELAETAAYIPSNIIIAEIALRLENMQLALSDIRGIVNGEQGRIE